MISSNHRFVRAAQANMHFIAPVLVLVGLGLVINFLPWQASAAVVAAGILGVIGVYRRSGNAGAPSEARQMEIQEWLEEEERKEEARRRQEENQKVRWLMRKAKRCFCPLCPLQCVTFVAHSMSRRNHLTSVTCQ